jgi:hypothetical protein
MQWSTLTRIWCRRPSRPSTWPNRIGSPFPVIWPEHYPRQSCPRNGVTRRPRASCQNPDCGLPYMPRHIWRVPQYGPVGSPRVVLVSLPVALRVAQQLPSRSMSLQRRRRSPAQVGRRISAGLAPRSGPGIKSTLITITNRTINEMPRSKPIQVNNLYAERPRPRYTESEDESVLNVAFSELVSSALAASGTGGNAEDRSSG